MLCAPVVLFILRTIHNPNLIVLKCSAVTYPDRRGAVIFSTITKVLFWLFTSTFWVMNVYFGVGCTYFVLKLFSFNHNLFESICESPNLCPVDLTFLNRWESLADVDVVLADD